MNTSVRFSSPVLDELDLELLENTFGEMLDRVVEILDSAPYEISIITCLLKRLEYKFCNYNQE